MQFAPGTANCLEVWFFRFSQNVVSLERWLGTTCLRDVPRFFGTRMALDARRTLHTCRCRPA